jgi:iron complex outermembrane receptor protein
MRSLGVVVCLPVTCAAAASSGSEPPLEEVVVTAERMTGPLLVVTDPGKPRQPLPAHDGADYLKAIPGFSVIRKGGTDGDPVFRGMAASRVAMSIDGQQILGGCGMRMDPPTAYVFPEAYDRIVVVKGPQTVLYGPGNSAAVVRFERDAARFDGPDTRVTASALGASYGRSDLVGDLRAGTPSGYVQATGTRAASDDYTDGSGEEVHSQYLRWSANGALGWTPSDATRVELGGALSDGEAAYADRSMDGVRFDRENAFLRAAHDPEGERVGSVEAQVYYNYVDHVMDNYSLRDFAATPAMPYRAASNPDRRTEGGRLALELNVDAATTATLGADLQRNVHTLRSTRNQELFPYQDMIRMEDGRFRNAGLFGEVTWQPAERSRLTGGLRIDDWSATDSRESLAVGMARVPNPTAGEETGRTLASGFVRYERMAGRPATLYAGVGHVERFPDYWELLGAGKESTTGLSAFGTRPERTTQLDLGAVFEGERLAYSLSGYYGRVDDYILIQSDYYKGPRRTTVTRNVDASTWGGEADLAWRWSAAWRVTLALAMAYGRNETDELPLAQMPPLELRTGLEWTHRGWSAGALFRYVAEQDRYVVGQGNVVGQDIGPTAGFPVLSLNAGWRSSGGVQVTAGIDNALDRTYAEHLSRAGAAVAGFEQTTRVNEPGRTAWLKVALREWSR